MKNAKISGTRGSAKVIKEAKRPRPRNALPEHLGPLWSELDKHLADCEMFGYSKVNGLATRGDILEWVVGVKDMVIKAYPFAKASVDCKNLRAQIRSGIPEQDLVAKLREFNFSYGFQQWLGSRGLTDEFGMLLDKIFDKN